MTTAKVIGNQYYPAGEGQEIKDAPGRDMGKATLKGVTAAALKAGAQTYTALTLATANIDQATAATAPAFARYIRVHCASAFRVAFGESSAAAGCPVPASQAEIFPIGAGGDNLVHAQSSTTLSVLDITYLSDL